MSKTVDQKVVEMRFDNKDFESNVKTSMSTLDKLKQSLNLQGASKGLESVGSAAKKIDFSGMSSGIEAVQAKFSALQVVGMTALSNITNSAINAGKKMVSALSVEPIMTGFSEYETQIGAVQTILANTESKGTTLTQVNAALDELNTYADQTIYNFTEMTKNIGTFTAAGVDLDKSVTSIKGIANLAAVSGSTSAQASTAMYQLSQALAAGTVTLQDWNSVVNAGMGGEVFQNALKRTAEHMGTNVDALIDKYGSFRTSLTEGQWLTTDVLTETLTQLSGAYTEADLIAQGYTKKQAKEIADLASTAVDAATKVKTFSQLWDTLKESAQSGWTQTWEILVGDFEEAKSLLTELSETFGNIINSSAESRNALLYDSMTSNWKKMTDGITEAGLSVDEFETKVSKVAKSQGVDVDAMVKDYGSLESAFKNGAISSDVLNQALTKMTGTTSDIKKKMTDLGLGLENNTKNYRTLTNAGIDHSKVQKILNGSIEEQVSGLSELSDEQLMNIGYTSKQVQSIRDLSSKYELASGSLSEFIDNISKPMGREMLIDTLRVSLRSLIDIFGAVGDAWREVFPPTTSEQLLGIIESIRNFALSLRPTEETLGKIQRSFRGLFSILSIAKQLLGAILSPIGNLLGNFGELGGGILNATASFGDWLYALDQSIKAGDSFSFISESISSVLDKISDGVRSVVDGIGGMSGVFSSVGNGISTVFDRVWNVVSRVVNWIRDNVSAGDIFAGLAGGGIFVAAKKFTDLIDKVKEAIEGLFKGGDDGGGIAEKFSGVLDGIHGSLESFTMGINAASLVAIAAAIAILSASLSSLSKLEDGDIAKSLGAMTAMFTLLNHSFKSISKSVSKFGSKGIVKAGISLILIAKAIDIFADALVTLADVSFGDISKGLYGLGVGLLELTLALKIVDKTKVSLKTSVAIIALAQASKMLAEALTTFSGLSWEEIARGLTAMGGALAELVGALAILSKVGGGGALLGSVGILIAVQSLDEISENLKKLGGLSWEEIGKGLSAMGGALGELTIALGVLSKLGGFGSILGGTAILITVQSLDEISENLKKIGSLSWEEIGKGLTGMGGALGELALMSGALGKIAGFSGILGSGSILIAAQALQPISDALASIGSMTWEEIGRGLTGMGGALLEVAGLSGALGKIAGFSALFGSASILITVQGLGDLADAFKKFAGMTWEEIGRGLTGMGGALGEVALMSGVLGSVAGLAGLVGGGSILLTIQGLGDLADALKKFGEMSWDEIGRGLSAMGAAMGETALGGLLNTLSGFGAGAIAAIAEPLGTLADSVKKWAGVKVPEGLGAQLAALAPGIQSFTFSGWGADAIATVATPIGTLADSVKKWSNVSIPEGLGEQLSALAPGIQAFTFGGWGASTIAGVAEPLGTLAESIRKWESINVSDDLPETLISLAGAIEAFSPGFMAGWSLGTIVDPLKNLADSVNYWNNVKVPDGLPTDLEELAGGINCFSPSFMAGWSMSTVVGPLSDLADSIKKWNGVKVPENIQDDLTSLANGINSFSGSFLGGWSLGSVVGPLNDLGDALKKYNGLVLDDNIGDTISSLGSAVKDLSNNSPGDITGVCDAIVDIGDAAKEISSIDFYYISSKLSSFADSINNIKLSSGSFEGLGQKMVDGFVNAINNGQGRARAAAILLANAAVIAFTVGVSGASSKSSAAGLAMVSSLSNGMRSGVSALHRTTTSIIDSQLKTVNAKSSAFKNAGSTLMDKLSSGISSKKGSISSSISSVLSRASSSIRNYYSSFYNSGSYLVQGLANGISANSYMASAKASAMASQAASAARAALKERSPSRVFYEIGDYAGLGFVNALSDYQSTSRKAGANMADSARIGLSTAMENVARLMESDGAMSPTIRPVIDLTNVKSGATAINRTLGGITPIRSISSANSISRSLSRNQNGSLSDVVSAVNKLRSDLGNVGGTTYSINGITYDDGTNVSEAVKSLVRAVKVERRI